MTQRYYLLPSGDLWDTERCLSVKKPDIAFQDADNEALRAWFKAQPLLTEHTDRTLETRRDNACTARTIHGLYRVPETSPPAAPLQQVNLNQKVCVVLKSTGNAETRPLWEVMREYGPHLNLARTPPFVDNCIYILPEGEW